MKQWHHRHWFPCPTSDDALWEVDLRAIDVRRCSLLVVAAPRSGLRHAGHHGRLGTTLGCAMDGTVVAMDAKWPSSFAAVRGACRHVAAQRPSLKA
jgi:hypothetical protein